MTIGSMTDFEKQLVVKQQRVDVQTQLFKDNQDLFQELTSILTATLKEGLHVLPHPAIIEGRVKKLDSFAEKCLRKWDKYDQPAWQLTDLCGVRVIVPTQEMVAPVIRFIEEHFKILEKENKIDALEKSSFGYLSFHTVVALTEKSRHTYVSPHGDISTKLFAFRVPVEAARTGLPSGPIYRAEIQVRTLLQHAWAGAAHDNLYKTEMRHKPRRLERQSSLIAAQLEEVDNALVQLVAEAQEYRSFYGVYLSPEQIREAIAINEIILRHEPDNTKAALKIARMADCLGDCQLSERVEQILLPWATKSDGSMLRELGTVQWKLGKKEAGRAHLRRAVELMPTDPDTLCELGRTFLDDDQFRKALPWYERAFVAAPQYPRALMGYIECRILAGQDATLDFIVLIRSNLEQAIEASMRRIQAGLHLPHAWYDIGFFQLLLGRNDESLHAYTKAVLFTASPDMVRAILRSLTEIQDVVRSRNAHLVEGLIWIRFFLRVMLVGRFKVEPPASLNISSPDLDGYAPLTSSNSPPHAPFANAGGPFFIVAGSSSQDTEHHVTLYETMIQNAFAEYAGILCCCGTGTGISGIMGRLPDPKGRIKKVVYQQQVSPCMQESTCVPTTTGINSPLNPLRLWSDFLIHGVDPSSVFLLGVHGDAIAAFEYRLALLLGAKVGVINGSGGASGDIADDPDWRGGQANASVTFESGRSRLLVLPADQQTLTAFVRKAMPAEKFDDATRESVAEAIHENYRQEQLGNKPDELAPWKNLPQSFKSSNRDQADDIGAKLRRANLSLRKVGQVVENPFSFTPEQIEMLAEMEHGRWVVERLSDGWVYGEQRDNLKKTRPQLVSWASLPESEKQKDRNAIEKLPDLLLQAGYQIVPKS